MTEVTMTWETDDEDFAFGYDEKHVLKLPHPRHDGVLDIRVIKRPGGGYAIWVAQDEWDLGKEPVDDQKLSLEDCKRDALRFALELFKQTVAQIENELRENSSEFFGSESGFML
jgi:hypothetical protein